MSVCEGCHSGCCRAFAVPVTGADILRISRSRGLSFWDFVCRWEDSEGAISRNHAPQFHFADEPNTPFVICLRHSASELFPHATRCQFLNENLETGEALCGVYEDRPSACRSFPVRLQPGSGLAILYDIPANGREGRDPAYRLCPRPWIPADVDPLEQVQALVVARYEMEFFHVLADSWNRSPGAWSDFPEFLELVYSRRVQDRPAQEIRLRAA